MTFYIDTLKRTETPLFRALLRYVVKTTIYTLNAVRRKIQIK